MKYKYLIILASLVGVFVIVLSLTLVFTNRGTTDDGPLVSTNVGLIRGVKDDNGVSMFLGVPYGKVGDNRFGAAEPYPAFDDVFEANDNTNICPQLGLDSGILAGTIDCLNMNIFVPDGANSTNRLPVMVWIHGGAFIGGNALVEAAYPISLFRHDVIVVAVNYRLGVFGFMCLDIPEVPGNTGLKDQVLALRWINENIEAFGGDANQITVFGESAGGMSTNLHLFSTYEKLFHRAIIQSGPATSYWMMVESDNTIPLRLAVELGLSTTDIYEALSYLNGLDPQLVAKAGHDLEISNADGIIQPLTKPCVEQQFDGVENFLTEHPMNMLSSKASTTPVIIGYTNIELAFQYGDIGPEFFESYDFSQHFAMGFEMSNNLTEALRVVNHFYLGDNEISENMRWEVVNFASDFLFKHPSHRMSRNLLQSGAPAVYAYVYSYISDNNINGDWPGAAHSDELTYLFDLIAAEDKTAEDQLVIDRITELWTNFAKYGAPTPTTSELLPVNWTPITETTYPYLAIDSDLNFESRPFNDRMAFWDLFYKRYSHYQKWYKA